MNFFTLTPYHLKGSALTIQHNFTSLAPSKDPAPQEKCLLTQPRVLQYIFICVLIDYLIENFTYRLCSKYILITTNDAKKATMICEKEKFASM